MSHAGNWNNNPRKLALERWREAVRQAQEADDAVLAPGWKRCDKGSFLPIMTPAAALLRGAIAIGTCTTQECRRRVVVDFRRWCDHGHGDERLWALLPTYSCARVRCGLHFGEETYPAGRPLIDYTAEPANRIEYRCRGCSALGRDPVEDFVRLLVALRTGDGNTPITKVAPPSIRIVRAARASRGGS